MALEELSRLLHYGGGITAERWGNRLRAAPSAGALYPIEVYPVIHRVQGLEPGLYHYRVQDHALELLRTADLTGEIVRHGLAQGFLGEANLVLVLTAIFQRLRWKYQERTYRYALLEAGHLGQNVYLAATSMGMGACAVGAFLDEELNGMLGIDGRGEAAIYLLAIGKL
jgi:SagB-type dehydrogenase family enzyme